MQYLMVPFKYYRNIVLRNPSSYFVRKAYQAYSELLVPGLGGSGGPSQYTYKL